MEPSEVLSLFPLVSLKSVRCLGGLSTALVLRPLWVGHDLQGSRHQHRAFPQGMAGTKVEWEEHS